MFKYFLGTQTRISNNFEMNTLTKYFKHLSKHLYLKSNNYFKTLI